MQIEGWLYTVPLRLRSLFRRPQVEQELDEEFRYHLECKIEQYLAQGLEPEAARHAAMRDMDGFEQRKEECRDVRGVNFIQDLVQDARYGLRNLRRAKWISVAAVTTLTLGIGTNTALFSVVYTVLLRSLPFREPDRLMIVAQHNPHTGADTDLFAPTTYFDWRSQNQSFQSMSAVTALQVTFRGRGEPMQLTAQAVSAGFLDMLGAQPLMGRTFRQDEDLPNRNNVVLISYGLWQNGFGGSQGVVGQAVAVDGSPATVIGVLPRDFEFLSSLPSLWMPLGRDPNARWMEGRDFRIVARLRPGASVAQGYSILRSLDLVSLRVGKVHGENDLFMQNNLVVFTTIPELLAIRRSHAAKKFSSHAKIHLAKRRSTTLRAPPLHKVFRVRPCLPDQCDWGIKNSCDNHPLCLANRVFRHL